MQGSKFIQSPPLQALQHRCSFGTLNPNGLDFDPSCVELWKAALTAVTFEWFVAILRKHFDCYRLQHGKGTPFTTTPNRFFPPMLYA